MTLSVLTRRRTVLGQEVREPTLLALALIFAGFAFLLAVCVVAVAGLPAFGHVGWTVAAVAVILAWLILGLFQGTRPGSAGRTVRQKWSRRLLGFMRGSFIIILVSWLGLFAWLEFAPGGQGPPPKADPELIRVITWNLHCGQDVGPPWKQFDWPARKQPLRAALDQARPDILSVQEATPDQVGFLEESLPGHRRVGIGRDGPGGEHCAIYFNRERFDEAGGGTFWLEEPIDQPRAGSALDVKRICTWVRLKDRARGQTLRVYNTHLYLTEAPRRKAARLILDHVQAGDPSDAVLLTADFNATPSVPSRRLFAGAGLADSALGAGKPVGQATFQLYGIGLWCIDGILIDAHWRVADHRVLGVKPHNTFPSDHFGLLADLELPGE